MLLSVSLVSHLDWCFCCCCLLWVKISSLLVPCNFLLDSKNKNFTLFGDSYFHMFLNMPKFFLWNTTTLFRDSWTPLGFYFEALFWMSPQQILVQSLFLYITDIRTLLVNWILYGLWSFLLWWREERNRFSCSGGHHSL